MHENRILTKNIMYYHLSLASKFERKEIFQLFCFLLKMIALKIRTFCVCKNLWSATTATKHGFVRCANLHMNVHTRKLFTIALPSLPSFYGLYDIWTDSFCQSHMRITFTDKNNYIPEATIFIRIKSYYRSRLFPIMWIWYYVHIETNDYIVCYINLNMFYLHPWCIFPYHNK